MSIKLLGSKILNSVSNLNLLYFTLKAYEKLNNKKPKIRNKVISFIFNKFLKKIHMLNQAVKYQPK